MNHSDIFHINNHTGEIILLSSLAHVTADMVVTLTVIAADHGVPPLASNGKLCFYLLLFFSSHINVTFTNSEIKIT